MRVLLTSSELDVGGLERNVLQLAAHLPDLGFEVVVVGAMSSAFLSALQQTAPLARAASFPKPRPADVAIPVRMARLLREIQPDVVHAHDIRSQMAFHPVARLLGASTVYTCHMSPFYYPDQTRRGAAAYRLVAKTFGPATDQFVFVSENERQLYLDRRVVPETKASVVYNGVSLEEMERDEVETRRAQAATRARLGLATGEVAVTFVGRLCEQKGLDLLLQAAALALPDASNLRFVLAGDGPLRNSLEADARHLAPGRVSFLGRLTRNEVSDLLAASDLFVLPSRFECFPYSTLEAMAAGLPCLVTDVGGNAEAIRDGYDGIVVPPLNPRALADALVRFAKDASLRESMGDAAKTSVRRFDTGRMVSAIAEIYSGLAGSRRETRANMTT